jgi:hypothetical protein
MLPLLITPNIGEAMIHDVRLLFAGRKQLSLLVFFLVFYM